MGIFTNPFFSIAGQVERLTNVAGTLNAAFNPFSKDKVQANVTNPTMKTALETVANHPYIAAGAAAGAITAVAYPAAALSAAKAAIPTTIKGKVAAAIAAPIVVGVIAKSGKAREALLEAPSSLTQLGAGVGELIEEPSLKKAWELVKEHPIAAGAAAAGAAIVVGGGIGLAANTVATMLNTKETKENTLGGVPQTAAGEIPTGVGAAIPEKEIQTAEGYPATAQTTTVTTGKKRYRRARLQEKPSVRQNVRVGVIVQNKATGRSVFLRQNRVTESYLKERGL